MPNIADAAASVAWGRGLYEATAGDAAAFTVLARDANGNNRLTSQVGTLNGVLGIHPTQPLGRNPSAFLNTASSFQLPTKNSPNKLFVPRVWTNPGFKESNHECEVRGTSK